MFKYSSKKIVDRKSLILNVFQPVWNAFHYWWMMEEKNLSQIIILTKNFRHLTINHWLNFSYTISTYIKYFTMWSSKLLFWYKFEIKSRKTVKILKLIFPEFVQVFIFTDHYFNGFSVTTTHFFQWISIAFIIF